MSFATMLVDAGLDKIADKRITLAVELANLHSAKLIGAAAVSVRPVILDDTVIPAPLIRDEYKFAENLLAARKARFNELAAACHQPADWRSDIDTPESFFCRHAGSADLIISGPNTDLDSLNAINLGELILGAGRPVLMMPEAAEAVTFRRVMVAWKNVREARRAVADALPFLHRATSIVVAQSREQQSADAAEESLASLLAFLSSHGISAISTVLHDDVKGTASQLLDCARNNNIDLIVAGGYGHSRLREWILGGVTQQFLQQSPVCCLFSH
jgi:nucleotide-binding universal stress UspA family protein